MVGLQELCQENRKLSIGPATFFNEKDVIKLVVISMQLNVPKTTHNHIQHLISDRICYF